MRLATERHMAQNVGGRLHSTSTDNSCAMLESLTGDDMCIQFGDYLNMEHNRPMLQESAGNDGNVGIHTAMEAKLGL